ncbi:TetR/AcrR family transcriptional regulator [Mycolicibacterium frederiksbergense]|uniref:TetR/AcrR family transcriptional regulator n=1 Tax=Mycolicibacterium frederiksbergense TaxID=117567 RepID=UPI00265C7085|nr:TetR family transcriptional regulator [Mycolicibacterium frederiksbergense]MDO0973902.1 TetR family transcriptional regulator [Mycolicibacterium frederiksbergense]
MICKYTCTAGTPVPKVGEWAIATRKTAEQICADIVDAAIEVAGHKGIDALTHRAVAQAAGVSLSSTTYHYASREDIIAAAFRHTVATELAEMRANTARLAAMAQSEPAKVRTAVDEWLRQIMVSEPRGRVYMRAQYELQLYAVAKPSMRDEVGAWQDETNDLFAHLFGVLGAPQPTLAGQIVVAAVDGLRLAFLTSTQSLEEADEACSAALVWLTGLILGG